MRVLVTGSAGFIGRRLVRALVGAGHEVGGLDRRDAPPEASQMTVYHKCDLLDRSALVRAVREFAPDAVAHLGARTDLDESVGLEGYAANIEGVSHLVEAVRATPSVRRCLWTSSQLVCRIGYVPAGPLDFQPDTIYGRSKVRTEEIVRANDGGGRDWVLLRPTTAWGPGMSPHYQRLLRMIRSGTYFHVGRGPLLKSYGYVDNMAHQYVKLLAAPRERVHGRVFFLADYEPIDLIAWCDALQAELNAPRIRTLPRSIARLLAQMGDVINSAGFRAFPFNSFRLRNILTQYRFNLDDTRDVCGPVPFTMREGVAHTVSWFSALEADEQSRAAER
jgi:nucleoside-diphosphate-sugar epimerase